jgi:aldehyde:ferredoxin oxidoreductase
MDLLAKKVLYIDAGKKTYEVKSETELVNYLGGVGAGLKLLCENYELDPVIFSVGPLNGFFPFCSKTSIVLDDSGVAEDFYIGGSLSSRIRFAGIDSIVLYGTAKEPTTVEISDDAVYFKDPETELGSLGLPGKRSILFLDQKAKLFKVDKYFSPPEKILETKLLAKNINNLVVTGTKTYEPKDFERYEEVYMRVLAQKEFMLAEKSGYPSCIGCPMGCEKSKIGEIGGNVLTHCLVACTYAENIFSDIGVVFSCLNSLGYQYTHEDLENVPLLVQSVLDELKQ